MGIRKLTILTCDNRGCSFTKEMEDGNGDYAGIGRVECRFGTNVAMPIWEGFLCDACEIKLLKRIKDQLPMRDSPPVKDSSCP